MIKSLHFQTGTPKEFLFFPFIRIQVDYLTKQYNCDNLCGNMKNTALIIIGVALCVTGTLKSQTISGGVNVGVREIPQEALAKLTIMPGLVKADLVQKFIAMYGGYENIPAIVVVDGMYDRTGLPVITFHMPNGLAFGEMHGQEVRALIEKHLLQEGESLLTADIGAWYVLRKGGVSGTDVAQRAATGYSGDVYGFTTEEHDHPTLGKIWFFNGPKGKAMGQNSLSQCQKLAPDGTKVQLIPSGLPGEGLVYAQ